MPSRECVVAWWSVHIETLTDAPSGVTGDEFCERLGDLVVALEPHHGVVTGGGERPSWGATISVESATALTAIADASAIIRRAAADVFLPDWPVVRAEGVREDLVDEDLARQPAS
jgi:hypothetical protein